jgi:cell division protein ZapE
LTALDRSYRALLAAGELEPDPDQGRAVAVLDRIERRLETRLGLIDRLLGRDEAGPRGAYLWGGVGRGKSMLMDLAFAAIAVAPKRRVHFHEFMIEVHDRLRVLREKEEGDPIPVLARAIAAEARLLAFDEMVIDNPADAMILSRLFSNLLAEGVIVIATSNRPPRDLYADGLNRELFLPFIDLIERDLVVVPLNGPEDYRLKRLGGHPVWYVPNGRAATEALSAAFFRMTDYPVEDRAHVPSCELAVGGRSLHVPKCLKGVAVFSFKRLCGEPRGAADYLAIARNFHTIFIVGIPKMGPDNRNEAARFTILIDALYEHKVKLLAAADAEPDHLYEAGDGAFEFKRTASRLIEMRSDDYLAEGHGASGPAPPAA